MLQRIAFFLVATAVGCGGATELRMGDDSGGSAGSGGGGGSGGAGGSGGGGGSGGTTSNTASTSANTSTVSTNTTGVLCPDIECAVPNCPDGELIVPPGACCPVCSCSGGECEPLNCPSDRTLTPPDSCCAECADAQCKGVVCEGPTDCEPDRVFSRPDGACCAACMPGPDGPSCLEGPCPDLGCAPGYLPGDFVGGCCYECLPDPLYCFDDVDCVLADRPRSCCGCPEAVSTRALEDDPCWVPAGEPWNIPEQCYPEVTCDVLCGECAEPGEVICLDHRCTQIYPL